MSRSNPRKIQVITEERQERRYPLHSPNRRGSYTSCVPAWSSRRLLADPMLPEQLFSHEEAFDFDSMY